MLWAKVLAGIRRYLGGSRWRDTEERRGIRVETEMPRPGTRSHAKGSHTKGKHGAEGAGTTMENTQVKVQSKGLQPAGNTTVKETHAITTTTTTTTAVVDDDMESQTGAKVAMAIKKSAPEAVGTRDISKVKVQVDRQFLKQLKIILRICVPTWRCKTVGIVSLHTFFLVLRTYLSLVIARLDGRLTKDLVSGDARSFFKSLGYWFAVAIPATYTNSMIKYLQTKLAIVLRSSLTAYVHKLYMKNNTYYKAINLDNRIDGADQLITTDVARFCTALASLYSNVGKPVLDMIIFNYQLARSVGTSGMWGLIVNYIITAQLLRTVMPSFGKMAAKEAKLEGDFRQAHSRIITNTEEIGFYHGADRERSILNKTYHTLIRHINHTYKIRIAYNMFEDFIIKYSWSAAGLMIASIPVFFPNLAGSRSRKEEKEFLDLGDTTVANDHAARIGRRTQGFITNKRLMVSLADAGGRIMYSYKELNELAGYTFRVYNMIKVMSDLSEDKYVAINSGGNVKALKAGDGGKTVTNTKKITLDEDTLSSSTVNDEESEVNDENVAPIANGKKDTSEKYSLVDIEGSVVYLKSNDKISFHEAPIVTPGGDTTLVDFLTFEIKRGDHLMITGPNGSGKSSIMRVLAGIWPLFRGAIERPEAKLNDIMYIPQRPYLALGTLRDQVIYPHTHEQMIKAGRKDEELMEILKKVYLEYIPGREGGWDTVKEWKDVFSGGEKQRMQLARVFYHLPRFVALDEATSAVSVDVEALLYSHCKSAGITVITISHRPSLFKYHNYLLRVGEGNHATGWRMDRIGGETGVKETIAEEIKSLQCKLENVDTLKKRLQEINTELSLTANGDGETSASDDDTIDGIHVTVNHVKRALI